MRAGPMNTRITFYRPKAAVSNGVLMPGVAEWVEEGSVAAERVKLSGRSVPENFEQWADYSAQFRIRMSRKPIAAGWRIRERGDGSEMQYVITNIIKDRALGMITLQCDRVNL